MKNKTAISLVATAALALTGCGAAGGSENSKGGLTQIELTRASTSCIIVFPLISGIEQGFFADEGIDLKLNSVDGSPAVAQTLLTGQADIGLVGIGPYLSAEADGGDLTMVYNQFARSLYRVVVPEDSDIDSPAELRGSTIGVGTLDGGEAALARGVLDAQGFEEDRDYTLLAVGDGGGAVAAFERGEIDAYAAAISDMAIIGSRGVTLEDITPDEFLSFFGSGYAVRNELVKNDPETVKGFGRAIVKATEWAQENPEKAVDDCEGYAPEEVQDTDFALDYFSDVQETFTPLDGQKYGYYPPKGWKAWEDSMLESGELDKPLDDLDSVYTNEYVDYYNGPAGE